jgi:hypothetical protein
MQIHISRMLSIAAVAAVVLATACDRDAGSSRASSGGTGAAAGRSGATSGSAGRAKRQPASYLGLQYDSLPSSFTYKGGSAIPRAPRGPAVDYDFAHVMTPRGEMIWLDTIASAPAHGPPTRMVRAELTIPPLANDERVFMASCDVGGKLDPLVVAIVVNESNATRFTKVRQAWRANIRGARFDVIPVTGVTCEDPGS